ncbi:hypothetical protein PFMALIP_05849 [Plasmodium falciparum MaliPS096_E11]|uniref:Uncharacterized protein n=1 Tax=Plasmodium falciparum MaliPS096_E11 TaxID=1036727 RepID=A0A024WG23_PLAFA|nr:hypothetical protein PFMALIP_05849 [Plasmodium falciparum MaliPS096_E11]
MQRKNLEYTQSVLNKYKDMLDNLINELKNMKGKDIQKTEYCIIIFLEFIEFLKKIIQENILDENHFFIYYQFKYVLNKNKEEILVTYGNYTFKYNYDILENDNMFINLIPNNKYIFTICSNIYKSYYNMIKGKNKKSTIKYITSSLGLRTHYINAHTNDILQNNILGSIQQGYALVIQNVDDFNIETLSVLTNIFRIIQTCKKK